MKHFYALLFLLACALATPAAALQGGGGGAYQAACSPAIEDSANPGNCMYASSVPALGTLLPLGPYFYVSPNGEVGIGTVVPQHFFDVVGDVRLRERLAVGNEASIGISGVFDGVFDFSHRITDFSSSVNWDPFRSWIILDPPADLTGPDTRYIYSHDMIVETVAGKDVDFEYVQGPYVLAYHEGDGHIGILSGALTAGQNNHGDVDHQVGLTVGAIGNWESTTTWNAGVEISTGHWGPSGTIQDGHGLYVYTPFVDGNLINHYGIYLEDQDVAQGDSYAIYAEGGTTYLGGDLGIGTDTPTARLDVAGDFVASGTKSFVQPHPQDPGLAIQFVCLEGNEAGTYFRGKGELANGRGTIDVPEEFRLVTEEEGLTVQLTPMGARAVLWVESVDLDRLVVRGDADVAFSYLVNGVRRGYAEFEPLRARPALESNASRRAADLQGRWDRRQSLRERIERPGTRR